MQTVCSSSVFRFAEPLLSPLQYIGQKCSIWTQEKKPIMDMMEELSPNILIVAPSESTKILEKAREIYNFTLIYFGFGKYCVEPDLWCVPENTPDDIQSQLVNPYIFRKCANLAKLGKGEYDDNYNYDLVYISDIDIFDNHQVRETLIMLSLLNLSFVIIGPNKIPLPQYLGTTTLKNKAKIIKSCKIGLDFNLTNAFNYAIYRKPCIYECGPQIIPKIQHYLNYEDDRQLDGEKSYDFVIKEERTDFLEAAKLLQCVGYKEIAQECQTAQLNLLAS